MLLLRNTNGKGVQEENGEESLDLQVWKQHWEVKFARDLCEQYEPNVWLPALVKLLEATSTTTCPGASRFVTYQLQGLSDNSNVHSPQVILFYLALFSWLLQCCLEFGEMTYLLITLVAC